MLILLASVSLIGCFPPYDFERSAIESSSRFDNSLIVDDLEREAMEKQAGEAIIYRNGEFAYQVTPLQMRYDNRTGKVCRDYQTDVIFRGDQKSARKTACKYSGQWYIVSIDGRSTIQSRPRYAVVQNWYMNYGSPGFGVPAWAQGFGYVSPMFGPMFGGYPRTGFGGGVYFNGRW